MKSFQRANRFVVLTDKDLPTDHSFLQGVLEKVLPSLSQQVIFVGYGGTLVEGSKDVTYKLVKPWSNNFILRKLQKLFVFSRIAHAYRPDVLITRNDPIYLVVAWILKYLSPQLVHVHQISHLHAYSTNLRKKVLFRLKASGDLFLRRFFLAKTDLILLISEEMKAFLTERWRVHAHKFSVYPLGVLTTDFKETPQINERIHDIAYIGTLSKSRELEIIVDGIEVYHKKWGPVTLNIWGKSHNPQDDKRIRTYVEKRGLSKYVRFHGQVPRPHILHTLKQVKVGLSVIPPKGLLTQISPTKLMEYMASGCFVIASKGIKDQDKIMLESGAGLLINFDREQLAEALHRALHDPTWREQSAIQGRAYMLKNRSYEEMGKRLLEDINRIRQ